MLLLPGGVPPAPTGAVAVVEDDPATARSRRRQPEPRAGAAAGRACLQRRLHLAVLRRNQHILRAGGHPGIDIDGFGTYGAPIARRRERHGRPDGLGRLGLRLPRDHRARRRLADAVRPPLRHLGVARAST